MKLWNTDQVFPLKQDVSYKGMTSVAETKMQKDAFYHVLVLKL